MGRGRPHKFGTLVQLFELAFKGTTAEAAAHIYQNLNDQIFGPATYPQTSKLYRTDDLLALGEMAKCLRNMLGLNTQRDLADSFYRQVISRLKSDGSPEEISCEYTDPLDSQ